MKRTTISTLSTLAGLLLLITVACHREAPVVSELGKPQYEIKDGSDYVSHTIYDIYKRTGLEIIYNFDPKHARWNLGSPQVTGPRYTAIDPSSPEDMKMVEDNLRYFAEEFLPGYSDDFIKQYFPLRCFMADTISKYKRGSNEIFATSLRDHIAFNMYREGEVITGTPQYKTREEIRTEMTPRLHSTLWAFIFAHRISAPTAFKALSQDFYNQNIGKKMKVDNKEDLDHKRDVLMGHGFWDYDEFNSFAYYRSYKDPSLDIADYIYRMTTMSEAEIQEAMGDYTIMHEKYDALRSFIKDKTGMDLQTIGNAAAKKRQTPGD